MLDLLLWILVFVAALFVLIKAANYFTESAEKIGLYFGMPSFLVGVTIVALGTSIPELATSLASIFRGSPEIVVGNVIGSNISNILLIVGLTAVLNRIITIKKLKSVNKMDIPLFLASAFMILFFSLDGQILFAEAMIMFIVYIAYMIYLFMNHENESGGKTPWSWKNFGVLILSGVFIYLSADWVVRSVVSLSGLFQIEKSVIAAAVVGFGTSLPELSVSLVAAKKGKFDISLGNVVGSNIFNSIVVLGIPGLFASLPVEGLMLSVGVPVMLLSSFMLFFVLSKRKIVAWYGLVFLAIYLLFIVKILGFF